MKLTKTASGKIKMSKKEWTEIGKKAGWIKIAMMDHMELGSTPPDEDCAQVGTEDYRQNALKECRRYIELIRQKLGPEPQGAQLKIKAFPHDFGTYYEVVCKYEDDNREAMNYAFACESQGPQTWDDTTPVTIEHSEPEEDLSESPEEYEEHFRGQF